MKLPLDFREFLELLNSENVRYLVIGGWAYNRYAEPRVTGDLDLFFNPDPETEAGLRAVLTEFGFSSVLPAKLFRKPIIMLGLPPQRIDLVTRIDGVHFHEAWAARERSKLDGIRVNFISKKLLLKNKRASGRDKDLLDVKNLSQRRPATPKKRNSSGKRRLSKSYKSSKQAGRQKGG